MVPKYSRLVVYKISEKTSILNLIQFFKTYGKKCYRISKKDKGYEIQFTKTFQATLELGSLLIYDGNNFDYVMKEDVPSFYEMFYSVQDISVNQVYYEFEGHYFCKCCNFEFSEKFDECPNCKANSETLRERVKLITNKYTTIKPTKKETLSSTDVKQYQCPDCNYISLEPFEKCPNCNSTEQSLSLEFTDVTKKLKTKRKRKIKMCQENQNNVQEVEEAEETKVTAVYGDCVSVPSSEVQPNPTNITNDENSNL